MWNYSFRAKFERRKNRPLVLSRFNIEERKPDKTKLKVGVLKQVLNWYRVDSFIQTNLLMRNAKLLISKFNYQVIIPASHMPAYLVQLHFLKLD